MKIYALFLFLVGCSGVEWKPLNDFKKTFEEYSTAAFDTIFSIQGIFYNSRDESESFVNDLIPNKLVDTIIDGITSECSTVFINNLRISFLSQVEQLLVPLKKRVADIKERLNKINTILGYYEIIAESINRRCKSVSGSCLEEANDWLESSLDILSFALCANCPFTTTHKNYTHEKCVTVVGDSLCKNSMCIGFKQICDDNNDSSDETDLCKIDCSPECGKNGLVCLRGPEGDKCLFECPPGTYETIKGCSPNPELPLATLQQVLEDTPRLRTRYEARLKYLKKKKELELIESVEEVLKCKLNEFKILKFFKSDDLSIDFFKKLLKEELASGSY